MVRRRKRVDSWSMTSPHISEERERERELALTVGTRVRLYGTLDEEYTVIGWREAKHGKWYTFRADHFGDRAEGYAPMVIEVTARPASA